MNDGFKKWVCNKAGFPVQEIFPNDYKTNQIEILIKAMWAINRDWHSEGSRGRYCITQGTYSYKVSYGGISGIDDSFWGDWTGKYDSETEALIACLKYIYEQEKG